LILLSPMVLSNYAALHFLAGRLLTSLLVGLGDAWSSDGCGYCRAVTILYNISISVSLILTFNWCILLIFPCILYNYIRTYIISLSLILIVLK
jgi:hypothetical protein